MSSMHTLCRWLVRLLTVTILLLAASSNQMRLARDGRAFARPAQQVEDDVWYSYTNGNAVRGLALDRDRNVLWAATLGGAVRWSLETATYTKLTTSDGLIDGSVQAVAVDGASGTTWFGTERGVSRLAADGTWEQSLIGEHIISLYVTPGPADRDVWAATANGAYHLDAHGSVLEHVTVADGLGHSVVYRVWQHPKSGDLWFGTFNGAQRRPNGGRMTATVVSGDGVFDFAFDGANEDLWIASLGSLLRVGSDGQRQTYTQANSGLPRSEVWRIAVHPTTGDVWFGGPVGVSTLHRNGTWDVITHREGLPAGGIRDLMIDDASGDVWLANHGDFWIGGVSDGAVVRIPMQGAWTMLQTNDQMAQSQPMTVSIDPVTGAAWFGGVEVIDRRGSDDGWRRYPVSETGGYSTESIAFDPKTGDAWLAAWELGVVRISAGGQISRFMIDGSRIRSKYMHRIHYDPRADLIVASALSADPGYPGLHTIDRTNRIKYVEIPGVPKQMPAGAIGTDAITGNLWIAYPEWTWGLAFPGVGIFFQSVNGTWSSINRSNSPLPTNDVLSYAADPATGERWFGTTMGLFRLRSDGVWEREDVPSQLRSTSVGQIKLDERRHELWVSSSDPRGVFRRDKDGTWSQTVGLVSDNVNAIDIDRSTGDVWFATNGGASRLRRVVRSTSCEQALNMAAGDSVSAVLPTGDERHLYRFHIADAYANVELAAVDTADALDIEVFRGCEGDIGAGRGQHIGAGRGQHIGGHQRLVFDVGSQVGSYYVAVRRKQGTQTTAKTYTLHLSVGASAAKGRRTLIITHLPRLQSLLGRTEADADWRALRESLTALADSDLVNGVLVENLQTDTNSGVWQAYGRWLAQPGDVARANAVVSALSGWIDDQRRIMPDLRYVVLVGDDRIVPHARVAIAPAGAIDSTWQSEDRYLDDTDLDPASAVGSALAGDFTLSDDPYAAALPQHVRGGVELAVPELALGRLVGEPATMTAAVRRFLDRDGQLRITESVAAGDDFMADAAEFADRVLSTAGLPAGSQQLWLGDWSSDDLVRSLWPDEDVSDDGRVTVVAAHSRHDGLRAPRGFVDAKDIAAARSPNGVAVVVGCHAGLDGIAAGASGDLPTAWLVHQAAYVAPTGWAYGTREFLGYQEALSAELLGRIAGGGAIGEALVGAKQAYFLGHDIDHLHAKTIAGTALFGLPMWVVQPPVGAEAKRASSGVPADIGVQHPSTQRSPLSAGAFQVHPAAGSDRMSRLAGGRDVWVKPDSRYPLSDGLALVDDGGAGKYFTYPGNQPTVEIGRTVQPGFAAELGTVVRDGQRLSPRGVVITRAAGHLIAGFTPRIASGGALSDANGRARRSQARLNDAGATALRTAPARLQRLERGGRDARAGNGERATLQIRVGAFDAARGEERLLDDIVLDEYYGAGVDRTGADVTAVSTATVTGGLSFDLSVEDPSGVLRIVVAYATRDAWSSAELVNANPERTRWAGIVPIVVDNGTHAPYLIQVVDGAGNVTTVDEMGGVDRPISEDAVATPARAVIYLPYAWRER